MDGLRRQLLPPRTGKGDGDFCYTVASCLFMNRIALLVLLACAARGQEVRRLTILHTNDLHARFLPDTNHRGGFAELATLVRKERAGCKHCLFLNAGDLVQGTPVSTLFKGTPVYEVANKLGFDASTLGNHEFDYGWQQVAEFMKVAKFPTVTANVHDGTGKLIAPKPYLIKKVNGMRVAIIGAVMTDLVAGYQSPKTAGPIQTLPAAATMARHAKELQSKVDLIIVLAHFSQREGTEVLKTAPEVSVLIEGHVHAGLKELEVVDGRVAANCEAFGINLCRLDLEVNVPQKKLVSWKWTKIPVDATTIKPAPDVKKLVDKWEKKVAEKVDVPIGEALRTFERPDLKGLIERAVLDEMKADFTFMNAGGVRDRLPQGTILARQIWNIMPFDNLMLVAKVPGSQVPEGLRGGRTLEPERVYVLALPDFVATNEAIATQLGVTGIQFQNTSILLRDVILDWVKKQKTLQ
jgi:5'-nucleotidase/UDP-sugar diphosphatase